MITKKQSQKSKNKKKKRNDRAKKGIISNNRISLISVMKYKEENSAELKRNLRLDPDYKRLDNQQAMMKMRAVRKNDEFQLVENKKNRQRISDYRNDDDFREVEKTQNSQRISNYRDDKEFRKVETDQNRQRIKKLRKNHTSQKETRQNVYQVRMEKLRKEFLVDKMKNNSSKTRFLRKKLQLVRDDINKSKKKT